jgi:Divergent InlB B-repeat domain
MRRRSPWLRCLRSRRSNDPDDGGDSLGCHVAEVRREHQRLAGRGGCGFVGRDHHSDFGPGSVALSADGNTAIVGAYGDNSTTGAAWVYARSGGVWNQQGNKLVGAGAGGASYQGNSAALSGDGNTAIVGGPGDNGNIGAAWVFVQPLQVTPYTNIAFSGSQGGPFSPSSFSYTLSATGDRVKYSITTPSWLTASPKSGTVTKAGKTITFRTNSSADKLVPNTYVSSISFNDTITSQLSATLVATLTVNPKQFKITVRASPSADGMVSGGGTFAEGSSQTVTAAPNTGHTFVHWTENGRVASTSASYTFTLNGNVTLVADFR